MPLLEANGFISIPVGAGEAAGLLGPGAAIAICRFDWKKPH